MTTPPGQDHLDDDGQGCYPTLETIDRDLERLGELTGPHVTDDKEDLSVAVARIPDAGQRREAEEVLGRLRPVIEPTLEAIDQAVPEAGFPGPGELRPA
ncbi:MAG: hypothetical protein M3Z75_11505 [Actinomycetota bacterium]|nr:hypothetical protein [Actinomycetota bacterium]